MLLRALGKVTSMEDQHFSSGKPLFINSETLLLTHFFLCSIGLLKIIFLAAYVIYAKSNLESISTRLFFFFSEYSFFREKAAELLQYGISIVAMFVYYALALYIIKRLKDRERSRVLNWALARVDRFWGFLSAVLAANVTIFLTIDVLLTFDAVLLLVGLWAIAFLCPIGELLLGTTSKRFSTEPDKAKLTKTSSWLLLLISLQILTVFGEYIVGPLREPNDFMDIPEHTWLDGGYVNNTTYINEHAIGGLNKYDPVLDAGNTPQPRAGTLVEIKNDALVRFIDIEKERRFGADRFDRLSGRKLGTRDTRYYYDQKRGLLSLRGRMPEEERIELIDLAKNEHERDLLNEFYWMASTNTLQAESRSYSSNELQFFQRNKIELVAQAKAGWFFHHHNAMLAPINAFSLGKPASEIEAQYGWLNSIVLSKLIEWRGGLSFENYIATLYTFYPLYLALLIIVAWVMLRNVQYLLLVAVLSFSAMLALGPELLRIAPGFNPIRHFLDVFVVLCVYLYTTRSKVRYLLFAILCALLAILCSREFGLFMMTALIVTLAVKQALDGQRRSRLELLLGALAFASTLGCVMLVKPAEHSLLIYSLIGVSAPSFHGLSIYLLLFSLSGVYLLFIKSLKANNPSRWTLTFLFLYCQGFTIYYVWNSSIHHLWAQAPMWALLLTMLFNNALKLEPIRCYQRRVCWMLIGTSLLVLYMPSLATYYLRDYQYRQIFATHRVYQWNFDRAKFETTMDPAYFQNGVDLIRRHSASKGIFIISKYDTLLPFLAGRYSAMPYDDVATSLVTQKEVDRCIDAVRMAKPEYIFVDTDIERNLNGDIWLQVDPLAEWYGLYNESFARVSVLNLLKRVYAGIREDYEPFEKGVLITVYRRKNA